MKSLFSIVAAIAASTALLSTAQGVAIDPAYTKQVL
jgi:hypothetical protein